MKKFPCDATIEKMMIFDYSGTLSRDASLFAKPDNLMKHLEASGLGALKIESPSIFWEQLVNPTWHEGSTTSAGYRKVMRERLQTILCGVKSTAATSQIDDAVTSFVDSYFRHSHIDRQWTQALRLLSENPSVITIIATDHYAEATDCIRHFLHGCDIQAISATEGFSCRERHPFIVANSADLGVHKVDPRFWELLKSKFNLQSIRCILMVDDFGYHEQKADRYADRENVEARRYETVGMLNSVFQSEIEVVPFMVKDGDLSTYSLYANLIMEVTSTIARFLTQKP
jgi:hypothetical protein